MSLFEDGFVQQEQQRIITTSRFLFLDQGTRKLINTLPHLSVNCCCCTRNTMRAASHAGSWYESNPGILSFQIDEFLSQAQQSIGTNIETFNNSKAIIAPHAGYRYSGKTAGYSYACLLKNSAKIKRVYVFGPSHYLSSKKCILSVASSLETPLGQLLVDQKEIETLLKETGFTKWNSLQEEEEEHSIEMHLPFVYRIYGSNPELRVIPIAVGHLSQITQESIAKVLKNRFMDPETVFIVSSDFCHWGSRFRYQYRTDVNIPIYQSIERVDRDGMSLIESKSTSSFQDYLEETKNTICGRHPISLLLSIVSDLDDSDHIKIKFISYAQSSQCLSMSDSSVSYAAGVLFFH